MIGDINVIRHLGERRGLSSQLSSSRRIKGFNDFIKNVEMMDIPMVGRKHTWYKPNDLAKNRLDIILVSQKWLEL